MGFYGNITNTANTTFSFDIIYSTRESLDANCDTDGVFLGRYVLVDYDDQEVIKAYFIITDEDTGEGQFYNKPNPNLEGDKADKSLEPRLGVIYQALNITADTGDLMFYKWNQTAKKYQVITDADKADTPYVSNFRADVEKYGRGYDSTVWVKHYDPAKNKYQYVMVAELNAAVPTFHLVTDRPTPLPIAPYIDRDTTNLDYYLHQQGNYGFRVHAVKKVAEDEKSKDALYNDNSSGLYSDEKVTRDTIKYKVNLSGYQDYETESEDVWLDIFYNNKGFNEDIHTNIDLKDLKDEIGYSLSSSGRKYGSLPLPDSADTADDTFDWHIRLPGIGNAICRMWDRFYGNGTDNKRYLNFAQQRNDDKKNLVTYDKDTVIGIVNTARDMLGYYYIPLSELNKQEGSTIGPEAITTTVTHKIIHNKGNITDTDIKYPILQCLYYDDDNNYYHYAYTPTYDPYDLKLQDGVTYYYETAEGAYRVANPEARKYNDANHQEQTLQFYEKIDGWTLKKIIPDVTFENSIYGLITEIHKLLGTNVGDTRDYSSIQGSINIIKDIVESLELKPNRLVCTNKKGQLTTYDKTYFPSATWDENEVLAGNGDWVSRFATISVLENSTNDNQNTSKVNNAKSGTEAGKNIVVIESDNNKDNTGARPSDEKKRHSPNNLTLGTRNKWIQLHADSDDDSIEFRHLESQIISRLRAEQAEGSEYLNMYNGVDANGNVVLQDSTKFANFSTNADATEIKVEPTTDTLSYVKGTNDQDDNRLTIPYIVTDNAGHIVELGTKNFNVPHTFKYLTISDNNTDDIASGTRATPGTLEADQLTDTWTMAPQNKWIDISKDTDDGITIGHKYSELPAHDFMNDIVIDDDINGSKTTDCPFEFPMPITDNAGHIIDYTTKKIYIPYNYRNIALLAQSSSEDPITISDGTQSADSTIDTFTFATGNQWIEARIDEDKITLAHAPIDADATKNWEFKSTASSDWQDAVADGNELIIPTFEIDNAGHIVRWNEVKFYIPNNFRNITVADATGADVNATQNSDTLEAGSTVDGWTIAPQNQWLKIAADVDKNQVTIGHNYSAQSARNFALDVDIASALDGTSQKDNKIIFPTLKTDNAGHIIGYQTNTFYIPHTFKHIHLLAQSTDSTDVTASNEKVEMDAENLVDTFTFATGNKWVQTTGDATNDRITFSHILSGVTAGEYGTNNNTALTPKFGDTFEVPGYKVDAAGHVTSSSEHTVMIPKGSYNNSASNKLANVITGMSFDAETGAITTTSENICTLMLTGYTKLDTTITAAITADNTIKEAFAALDNRIETEEKTRANLGIFKTIKVGNTYLNAGSNADTLSISAGNDGIILTPADSDNSFTISHNKPGQANISNTFYKFSTDVYGHISATDAVTLDDLTNLGVATANNAALTGTPTAPTADETIKTTQLATTEYVHNVMTEVLKSFDISLHEFAVNISEDNGSFIITIPEKEMYSDLETYTYQWQWSTVSNMGWTNITGATSNTYTPTQSNFYRCRVTKTCCGLTKTISSDSKEFKAS